MPTATVDTLNEIHALLAKRMLEVLRSGHLKAAAKCPHCGQDLGLLKSPYYRAVGNFLHQNGIKGGQDLRQSDMERELEELIAGLPDA